MKILKYAIPLIAISIIAGCSTKTENQSDKERSAEAYETKELTAEDLEKVSYGDSIESVYETLGKPLKEWSSEFVYNELEDSIERNEFMLLMVDDSSEQAKDYEKSIEQANKAKEINKLKLLQYTYIYDDNEQTALFWISPRTDTVAHYTLRGFIDENGEQLSESGENTNIEDTDTKESFDSFTSYSVGDTVSFSSEDGESMDVTINSVSKFSGDDMYSPEGNFFAKVDFTVKNTGTSAVDVNSHFFEFYDSEDIKSELDSKDFFSETIQAGKSANGVVYFDVISEGSTFEIFFADTSWTGEYQ